MIKINFILSLFFSAHLLGARFASFESNDDDHKVGNGGFGVEINGNNYLYDFYEAGIESEVYIRDDIEDLMNAKKILLTKFYLADDTINKLSSKLNEIYLLSPSLAYLFLEYISTYDWRFPNAPVFVVNDRGSSPLEQNNDLDYFIISQRDDKIRVVSTNKANLNKLSSNHQVGLIFHEAIYGLFSIELKQRDSYEARSFVAHFFSPTFRHQTYELLIERVQKFGLDQEFLSHDDYIYYESDEFNIACKDFQLSLNESLKKLLNFFNKEIHQAFISQLARLKAKKKFNGFSNKDEWNIQTQDIQIDGRVYFLPTENYQVTNQISYRRSKVDLVSSVASGLRILNATWDVERTSETKTSTKKIFPKNMDKFYEDILKAKDVLRKKDPLFLSKCIGKKAEQLKTGLESLAKINVINI